MSAAATTELTAVARSPSLPTFFDNLDSFAEAPEGVLHCSRNSGIS